jgi:hypothetical protein
VCSTEVVAGVFDTGSTDCQNGGARSLMAVLSAYPNAAVDDFGFSQSAGGGQLAAAVDKLNVGAEVYDFEPSAAAPTVAAASSTHSAPPVRPTSSPTPSHAPAPQLTPSPTQPTVQRGQ